mgnify:FL=1
MTRPLVEAPRPPTSGLPRMRIAFVSYDFGEYCVRIASALAVFADVLLCLPGHLASPYMSLLNPRVELFTFEKPRLRSPIQQLGASNRLCRAIRAFSPDLLHLQQGHMWFNLFALPRLRSVPLVVTVHDPRHHVGDREGQKTWQGVYDLAFRQARHLIVHGEQQSLEVQERLNVPPSVVSVVPHVMIGEAAAGRDDPAPPESTPTVLFFGRIWPYKGLDYLIQAQPAISRAVPEARIVIAGEGEDFSRYRRLMKDPEAFIVHNEYVPDDRRDELFRAASVVVLPYIDASQSGVVPVAQAHAKPVVVTSAGSLAESVEDGTEGYVVPPRDSEALANAVIRLLQDPQLRRAMGKAGRERITTRNSPTAVARLTARAYYSVLAPDAVQREGTFGWNG